MELLDSLFQPQFKTQRSTHPENVIDKQPPQEDAAGADVVQVEQLHAVEGKRQPKQVVGYPVLWRHKPERSVMGVAKGCGDGGWRLHPPTYLFEQVPDSHSAADHQAHQVFGVKLIIEHLCRHGRRFQLQKSKLCSSTRKQSPHWWTDVQKNTYFYYCLWPSGGALAEVVNERREEDGSPKPNS